MSSSQGQGGAPGNEASQGAPHPPARHQVSDPASELSNGTSIGGPETRSIVKDTTQGKLLTYQIAAVVSAVLAGTESQLLLFFKTSSNFNHPPAPATLRWLLILTYTALIFSISSTVSSLVLTENIGDSLGLTKRLRKSIKKSRLRKLIPRQRRRALATLARKAAPRRWRWMEYHWIFTLVVSVLCLLVQILVYIWIQELVIVKAVIAVVGLFGMLPLLHCLPIPRGPQGIIHCGPEEIKPRSLEEGTAMAQPRVTGSPHTVVSMLPSNGHSTEPSIAA